MAQNREYTVTNTNKGCTRKVFASSGRLAAINAAIKKDGGPGRYIVEIDGERAVFNVTSGNGFDATYVDGAAL